ncbi:MAG: Ig-like domain-containing protein [Bacteroidales bacterium]|nr:Ig-like domain-containing protein [Bacteroidales bacterium]
MLVLGFSSCAQQGALVGGPKDETPPKVVISEPPNYSTGITTNSFKITFDEYFVLKNAREKLVVSPPMKERPELKIKGKTLYIKILDSLQPDRTYALNFGDALVDLNENNPLDNFQFVFSTGNEIDSLEVSGRVVNASDTTPGAGVAVMLYARNEDSLPMIELPVYLAKTDKEGKFTIRNIAEGDYKIFALKDANSNFLFDQPAEPVAFLDSLMHPGVLIDTLKPATDSAKASIRYLRTPQNIRLRLFTEHHPHQYLASSERLRKDHIRLIFNEPADSVTLRRLDTTQLPSSKMPVMYDWYADPDTINVWIMDTLFARPDTLPVLVTYPGYDSLEQMIPVTDTLKLAVSASPATPAKSKKSEKKTYPITLTTSVSNSHQHEMGQPLTVTTSVPTPYTDTTKILLYPGNDSTPIPLILPPSQGTRPRFHILTPALLPDSAYRLEILPGAFRSIRNETHDTLKTRFTVKGEADYGSILIHLPSLSGHGIVELLKNNKKMIRRQFLEGPGTAEFRLLDPGKYHIKLILDTNGNGKWDTGRYLKHLQPEKVLFYAKELTLKANWEIEETWDWNAGE